MKNFYIRLLEYGVNNEKEFKAEDILNDPKLSLGREEKKLVEKYLKDAYNNSNIGSIPGGIPYHETPFLCVHSGNKYNDNISTYNLTFSANLNYIDYLELKEARSASKKAFITALIAIIVAGVTLLTSVFSSITMDSKQFNQIIDTILLVK